MKYASSIVLAVALCACGSSGEGPLAPGRPAPVDDTADDPSASEGSPAPATPSTGGASNKDGPHISRSRGEEDGVVVFWPRVIPRTEEATIVSLAADLQKQLVAVTKKALPGIKIDVRPEPERVCPRSGCEAMTVGVLLTHGGGGCTAMALVSEPGTSEQRILPWGGLVKLAKTEVPFREHPESQVTVRDSVPCQELLGALSKREPKVVQAIQAAAD